MADVTAAIRDHLEADGTITAVVGTKIRRVRARTSDTVPYIVITEIDNVPEHHLDGGGGIAHASVQIACHHTSRGAARALSDLVFVSLDSRVSAVMGDDSLEVEQVIMERRVPLDDDPDDASQQGPFKDVCEFTVSYVESETP
jgi:hypothetical protein